MILEVVEFWNLATPVYCSIGSTIRDALNDE
jgi:hypothetical protein